MGVRERYGGWEEVTGLESKRMLNYNQGLLPSAPHNLFNGGLNLSVKLWAPYNVSAYIYQTVYEVETINL